MEKTRVGHATGPYRQRLDTAFSGRKCVGRLLNIDANLGSLLLYFIRQTVVHRHWLWQVDCYCMLLGRLLCIDIGLQVHCFCMLLGRLLYRYVTVRVRLVGCCTDTLRLGLG